jgi:N-acetylglucosaminyl-diphospho-decaprenol L-rhamnosyltransferase
MTAAIVDQPAGAFLMFSSEGMATRSGGFDERFHPIWFEDVDFCARDQIAGVSYLVRTSAPWPNIRERTQFGLSRWRTANDIGMVVFLNMRRKHYRSLSFRTVCVAVAAGAAFRAVRGIPRRGPKLLQFIAVLQVLPWAGFSVHGGGSGATVV